MNNNRMIINFYFFWPPRPELQRYHNYPFSLVLTGHQQSKLEMHFDGFLKGWNYFEKEEKRWRVNCTLFQGLLSSSNDKFMWCWLNTDKHQWKRVESRNRLTHIWYSYMDNWFLTGVQKQFRRERLVFSTNSDRTMNIHNQKKNKTLIHTFSHLKS